jgi:hypothetical protein
VWPPNNKQILETRASSHARGDAEGSDAGAFLAEVDAVMHVVPKL